MTNILEIALQRLQQLYLVKQQYLNTIQLIKNNKIEQQKPAFKQFGNQALVPSRITQNTILTRVGDDIYADLQINEAINYLNTKLNRVEDQIAQYEVSYYNKDFMDNQEVQQLEDEIKSFVKENINQFEYVFPKYNVGEKIQIHNTNKQTSQQSRQRISKFGMETHNQ